MAKTLIVVAGPTAIGKTSLAIRLANYYDTEIISADSRQFYREMEIGTAKPNQQELEQAKHHFINSHSVRDSFSVGDYEKQAIQLIEELFLSKDQLILTGGSGLFINAILNGFDELPATDPEIRERLNREFEELGLAYLQNKLKELDPVYYAEVDVYNPQRVIRALEVYESSGTAFSTFRKKTTKTRSFATRFIGLTTDRDKLYANINQRVDKMIDKGLIEEVRSLLPFRELNTLNTVGYSEIFEYLDGRCSLTQAIEKIKQNTRRFAKRQLTWFKKSDTIRWFEPDDFEEIISYIQSPLH